MINWLLDLISGAPKLTPEQDAFLASATSEFNSSLEEYEFVHSDDYDEWKYDQYSGVYKHLKEGKTVLEADAQIAGSVFSSAGTWEWAWNNPNVEEAAKVDSYRVKEYGERENIEYFKTGIIPLAGKSQGIYFSSVAMKLSGSQTVVAVPMGECMIFLLLKNIRIV